MARAQVPVVTCDVCGRSELLNQVKVDRAEVSLGEARKAGDLCEDHAGPVRDALAVLPEARPKRKRRRFEDSILADPSEIPRG